MFPVDRRGLEGRKEGLEEVVRSLILKLIQEEEEGGLPLVVRAALDPVGHLVVIWLMRSWDSLPCTHQLEAVLEAHAQQIRKDPIGCFVVKAQAAYL